MKKLLVVTHGESTHHIERKVGRWCDCMLTEKGSGDAFKTAKALSGYVGKESYKLYSSDLKRAQQTAKIIAK